MRSLIRSVIAGIVLGGGILSFFLILEQSGASLRLSALLALFPLTLAPFLIPRRNRGRRVWKVLRRPRPESKPRPSNAMGGKFA